MKVPMKFITSRDLSFLQLGDRNKNFISYILQFVFGILFLFNLSFAYPPNSQVNLDHNLHEPNNPSSNYDLLSEEYDEFRWGRKFEPCKDDMTFRQIGRWARARTRAIAIQDSLLLYSCGSTLFIADISNPEEHQELDHSMLPNPIIDIGILDETAYAVVAYQGLYAIDFSNPRELEIVDTSDPFWGHLISVDDDHLAVSSFEIPERGEPTDYGFSIFDVSQPHNMEFVSCTYFDEGISFQNVQDIILSGNQCYLIQRHVGVQIYDIRDPENPELSATIDSTIALGIYSAKSIEKKDTLLIAQGDGTYFLNIRDLNEISNLRWFPSGQSRQSAIFENTIYMNAGYSNGYNFVDFSNPEEPEQIFHSGEERTDLFDVYDFAVNESNLFCAARGYYNVGIQDPEHPEITYHQEDTGYINSFLPEENRLVCYQWWRLYSIIPGNNGEYQFGELDYHFTDENINRRYLKSLSGKDGFYYLFDDSWFKVIDATDPDSVSEVNSIFIDYNRINNTSTTDDFLYVFGDYNFGIFDISDPANPDLLSEYRFQNNIMPRKGVVHNERAFIISGANVYVLSVENPNRIRLIGQFQVQGNILDAVIENDIFYSANGLSRQGESQGALIITDISDINNTRDISISYIEDVLLESIVKVDNHIIVAGAGAGVRAFDVSDLENPEQVAHYQFSAERLFHKEGLIYAIGPPGTFNEMKVLSLEDDNRIVDSFIESTPVSPALISQYPNPCNSSFNIDIELTTKTKLQIQLFDLKGRKVKEIYNDFLSSGNKTIPVSVNELPTGLYILQVRNNDTEMKRKLTVMR